MPSNSKKNSKKKSGGSSTGKNSKEEDALLEEAFRQAEGARRLQASGGLTVQQHRTGAQPSPGATKESLENGKRMLELAKKMGMEVQVDENGKIIGMATPGTIQNAKQVPTSFGDKPMTVFEVNVPDKKEQKKEEEEGN